MSNCISLQFSQPGANKLVFLNSSDEISILALIIHQNQVTINGNQNPQRPINLIEPMSITQEYQYIQFKQLHVLQSSGHLLNWTTTCSRITEAIIDI